MTKYERMTWLGVAVIVGTGLAQADVTPVKYVDRPVESVRVVEKVRTKVVRVPAKQPDGYITEGECRNLETGMHIKDIVYRFGWPGGDIDSYSGYLTYPLSEDHDRYCSISLYRSEVDSVNLEL
jgi:hypothetical protein